MSEMDQLVPAFDLLPYTEALARGCLLFRNGTELIFAFGDPFNASLRPWAEERIPSAVQWRLAHPADVSAFLARHGETMRAMDSLLTQAVRDEGNRGRLEELSLKTISEDASPVVRLVHSTLYDALKSMDDFELLLESPIRRASFIQGFQTAINLLSAGLQ